ncbi:MAG: fatty acid desaturase [Granulosicoccus sp.]
MLNSSQYPPLSEVRKTLRVQWYRCPIATSTLHDLLKRSDLQGFKQAGGHFGLWLLTGSLVYVCWSQQVWWLLAFAVFAHGTVSTFFVGTAVHELGHGTVFKTPVLNKVFLYLFSLIGWWDPFDYASSHTFHHRYTLHPVGDRENLLPLAPNTRKEFLLQMLTFNLFTKKDRTFGKGGLISAVVATAKAAFGKTGSPDIPSNEWLVAIHGDQPAEFRKSILWSRLLLVFHAGVVFVSVFTGHWIFILIITLAAFTANLLSYLLGTTQHAGLQDNVADFRKCTRSIVINPLFEFLYWHMNWHTEHHMYAGVPCYNLKKLHQIVRTDMPDPRSLRGAWKEIIETREIQKKDPAYYFDTPLPISSSSVSSATRADEFDTSIGELAPPGLR